MPALPAGCRRPRAVGRCSEPGDQHRRSVYISVRRTATYPMLEAFDMPDTHRELLAAHANHYAPQALTLLNAEPSLEWAQAFAGRVIERAGSDRSAQVAEAFRLAYSRQPDAWEKDRILTFLSQQREHDRGAAGQGRDARASDDRCRNLDPVGRRCARRSLPDVVELQ